MSQRRRIISIFGAYFQPLFSTTASDAAVSQSRQVVGFGEYPEVY